MTYCRIIYGIDKETGKSRDFMEINEEGVLTYRNYKRGIRKWGVKYGAYGSIKQHPGEAHFFDVGKLIYDVNVIRQVEEIDNGTVTINCKYVDKRKHNNADTR